MRTLSLKPAVLGAAFLAAGAVMCGCAGGQKSGNVGMANPASVFCIESGGESVEKKDISGAAYRVCKFKDGREIEEWEYFRAHKSR